MLYQTDHLHIAELTTNAAPVETAVATPALTAVAPAETPSYETSDEQLMGAIQGGDQDALNTLYRRHSALLRTVISRVVNNDQDTDDTVQDVLLGIWQGCAGYDETKGKALGWIVTLARRRAIDRVRRRQAYHRAEERNRLEVQAMPEATYISAADDADSGVRAEAMKRILATLPEAQRTALEMAFYRGLSQREIARELNVPLGTIKTRLELGVRKVRGAILAMGGREEWSMAA